MSGEDKDKRNQQVGGTSQHQPIFNMPAVVLWLCAVMLAIQAADSLVLNEDGRASLLTWLAFVPYRLVDPVQYIGGLWPLLWTPLTHAFLHGGWEHVLLNVAWLAIFGTPVAQRYGSARMLLLFLLGAFLGAWAFALTDHAINQYLVGASGGIAALTGAAIRFIFQPPVVAIDPETGERKLLGRKLASIPEMLRNPTARTFALFWVVLNGVVPLLPLFMGGAAVQIAWQTHLAGFVTGLLLVPLLERKSN